MSDLETEFLYLELTSCARCRASDQNLRETLAAVSPMLEATGSTISLRSVLVETEHQAQELRLTSSPIIRINGTDIADQLHETGCADCGQLRGRDSITCRVWTYQEGAGECLVG